MPRAATAAPAVVRPRVDTPDLPVPFDEERYGEAVRWHIDREMEGEPPEWNLLLLDKTYETPDNTLSYVVGCLVTVLGLAQLTAQQKAKHAQEHFFALLQTFPTKEAAFEKARRLRNRKLLVRVTPAAYLPSMDGDGD